MRYTPKYEKIIRATLRQRGLMSSAQVANLTGLAASHVSTRLKKMPDAYIERWARNPNGGRPFAVWGVVVPPPNAPHPKTLR